MKIGKNQQEPEENIFNAVAPDFMASPKGKLHKSKHPGNLPPTGTTFGLLTTSAKVEILYNFRLAICTETLKKSLWAIVLTLITSLGDHKLE